MKDQPKWISCNICYMLESETTKMCSKIGLGVKQNFVYEFYCKTNLRFAWKLNIHFVISGCVKKLHVYIL